MKKNKKKKEYVICVDGHRIPVTQKVYEEYKASLRKERYFMEDLKRESYAVNQETQTVTMIPSREDSLDRLWEQGREFAACGESPEDAAIKADLLEKLARALHTLSNDELRLIQELFYLERTEREVCSLLNMPSSTIHDKKKAILRKLKNRVEKFF